jgi:uncharacterized YigZ family protein
VTEGADSDQVDTIEDSRVKVKKVYEAIFTLEVKKSRFICHLFPITSENEAVSAIADIRKKYRDASHNCYAYIINGSVQRMRYSDDGEPGGTAGLPMLRLLESNVMTNTLAVVTRYFGGTLLGTGGLTRAYSRAVSEGLSLAEKVRLVQCSEINMILDYHDYTKIENMLREDHMEVTDIKFLDSVEVTVVVPFSDAGKMIAMISNKTDGRAVLETGGCVIREFTL